MGLVKRGEVRRYQFGRPDKERPVLILTRSEIIPYMEKVTIAQITTKIRQIPTEVFLSKDSHGMPKDCVINLDNIYTIPKSKIGKKVTVVPDEIMEQVKNAIMLAFGF